MIPSIILTYEVDGCVGAQRSGRDATRRDADAGDMRREHRELYVSIIMHNDASYKSV